MFARGLLARLGLGLAWVAAGLGGCAAPPPAEPRPPNIVLLLADDMEEALQREMPQLAEMRRAGATFTNAFVNTPICAPSRATVLTGRYAQNTGVRANRLPFGGHRRFLESGMEQRTFAVWLRDAGYRTALIGKYLNFYPEGAAPGHVPPGWGTWVTPADNENIHKKLDVTLNENGKRVTHGGSPGDYVTEVYTRKAVEFIRASAAARRPFLLYLAPPSPHTPLTPEAAYGGLFPGRAAPRGPASNEADVSDKPPFLRRSPLTPAQVAQIDDTHRQRLRLLQSVDEMVRAVRAALAETGALADTYLVFTSDNGWHAGGEHRLMPNKTYPYDTDLRVPLVVTGPGVKAGTRVDRLVGNADLAPTFAAWAGATAPAGVDGRSLVPLLAAADPAAVPWRERLPILRYLEEAPSGPAWPAALARRGGPAGGYACLGHLPPRRPAAYRGLRDARRTYVEYDTGDAMLFDDLADPHQLDNLVCRADAGLLERLHRSTVEQFTCAGAACRAAEDR